MEITTIINMSSLEQDFIPQCIRHSREVSKHVIACYSDKLFTGEPEDLALFESYKEQFPDVTFLLVPFDDKLVSRFMHNRFRATAFTHVTTEWVLFLDADEIIDVPRFKAWMLLPKQHDSYGFACTWYFRLKTFQAASLELAGLLIKTDKLSYADVAGAYHERWSICKGNYQSAVMYEDVPMIHHYSWVRTKEQMLKKVRGWGHKEDRSWESLVEQEFALPPDPTRPDFVHGYTYNVIP